MTSGSARVLTVALFPARAPRGRREPVARALCRSLEWLTRMSQVVQIGQVLAGKYRVEQVLGQGGMGVVVAAMHLQLGQLVALKFLLPHMCEHGEGCGPLFARGARSGTNSERARRARD